MQTDTSSPHLTISLTQDTASTRRSSLRLRSPRRRSVSSDAADDGFEAFEVERVGYDADDADFRAPSKPKCVALGIGGGLLAALVVACIGLPPLRRALVGTVAHSAGPTCTPAGSTGCGHQIGAATCPTAAAPSVWCNDPAHPARMSNGWCATEHCEQCAQGFGKIYVGCVDGSPVAPNACRACGTKNSGPCQPGVLANDATCHFNDPTTLERLSLMGEAGGCHAGHCTGCGLLNAKPCNNGDGMRICNPGLAPGKCVVRAPPCRRSLLRSISPSSTCAHQCN